MLAMLGAKPRLCVAARGSGAAARRARRFGQPCEPPALRMAGRDGEAVFPSVEQ